MNQEVATTDNTNRNFKGQTKTEEVICFARRHWVVLVLPTLLFWLLVTALVLFMTLVDQGAFENFVGEGAYHSLMILVAIGVTFLFH